MAGTPRALVQTALRGFTASTGVTCHDAILEWLEGSEYVPSDAHVRLFPLGSQRPLIYAQVLARASDPRIMTITGLNQLPLGTIIGFYLGAELKHSVLVAGTGILVGANNAGVWNPRSETFPRVNNNLHAIFLTSQLLWNLEDSTVGEYRYVIHYQAPREIADRILQAI